MLKIAKKTVLMGFFLPLLILHPLPSFASLNTTMRPSLAPILKNVIESVVNIRATGSYPPAIYLKRGKKSSAPIARKFASAGSGIIVDAKKGYIITNAHVIKGASSVIVTLNDGRHYKAKPVGVDAPSDIAVIQIHLPHLVALKISNSNTLKVGDYVIAIGNPFGLGQSVSSGIISALKRTNLNIEGYENFIQTDAPINMGSSGGALVNLSGELVGMNTAIVSPGGGNVGIGFAIPSNMVKNVMKQLIQYGKVERGILGINVQTLSPEIADALNLSGQHGAIVTQIDKDSSANDTRLQIGDVILQVNNDSIQTASSVINTVGFLRIGSTATFQVLRKGRKFGVSMKISSRKEVNKRMKKRDPYFNGVVLANIEQSNSIQGFVKGVLMMGATPNSNAWNLGMRPGDIIISINKRPTHSIAALRKITRHTKKPIVLNVLRAHSAAFIVLTPALI
jgi:serine protease Do